LEEAGFCLEEAGFCWEEALFCLEEAGFCWEEAGFCLEEAGFCWEEAGFCLEEALFCLKEAGFCWEEALFCLEEALFCFLLDVGGKNEGFGVFLGLFGLFGANGGVLGAKLPCYSAFVRLLTTKAPPKSLTNWRRKEPRPPLYKSSFTALLIQITIIKVAMQKKRQS
jgi:hypothetical protein